MNPTRGPAHSGHLDEDICLDLVHELFRPEEEEPLLAHLQCCAACQELLRVTAGERERLRATAALERGRARGRAGAAVDPWWARWLPGTGWIRAPRLAWGLVAAGAAVAVLLTLRPARSPQGFDAGLLRWLPEVSDTRLTRKVGGEEADSNLVAGLAAYADHDAAAAVRRLEKASASGPMESLRVAYLGNALAWAGRYEESASILQDLPAKGLPEPWQSETRWTLALAWKASGRTASADSLISLLAAEPGAAGERARMLRGSR